MRKKDDILRNTFQNINKAPAETRPMLWHEYYFIEVLTDIRDILNDLNKSIGSNIFDHMRES